MAIKPKVGLPSVDLDFKNVCHHGVRDLHSTVEYVYPGPYYHLYRPLLAPGKELRWKPPGIADDKEGKVGESRVLGRMFARGYLDQCLHYRWFAPISILQEHGQRGWSAERAGDGDLPDWLVAKKGNAAIAEAKGRSRSFGTKEIDKWRKQVTNVHILKNKVRRNNMKSWILANRWVNSDQPGLKPTLYVEDPDGEGQAISDEEWNELELWVGRIHTYATVYSLQMRLLAIRILVETDLRREMALARVALWRCVLPQLRGLEFVSRRHHSLRYSESIWPISPYLPHPFDDPVFEGMDLRTIKGFLSDQVPEEYRVAEISRGLPPDVSYQSDGSFLAPLELMEPISDIQL